LVLYYFVPLCRVFGSDGFGFECFRAYALKLKHRIRAFWPSSPY
jgi:hypothetical protein